MPQPARKLPPGVLDIDAPQYSFPPNFPEVNSPTPRVVPTAIPNSIAQAPRRLSATDARLVRFLRSRLGFQFGAEYFVRKHGAHAILAALHDGILVWIERHETYHDAEGNRRLRTVDERVPNPRLKSPAAVLNKMLNNP